MVDLGELSLNICPSLGLGLIDALIEAGRGVFGQFSMNVCAEAMGDSFFHKKPFVYIGPMSLLKAGVSCKRLCLYPLEVYEFVGNDDGLGKVSVSEAILTPEVGYKSRPSQLINFSDKSPVPVWFVDSFETMLGLARKKRLPFISAEWKVRSLLQDGSLRKIIPSERLPGGALYFVSSVDDDRTRGFRETTKKLVSDCVSGA